MLHDGSFLLSQSFGYFLLAFGPGGHLRWKVNTGSPARFGTVPDGTGGWITVASYDSDNLFFKQIDSDGRIVSQATVPGYPWDYWMDHRLNSLLRAPDGSFRMVMNLSQRAEGIAVSAFAEQDRETGAVSARSHALISTNPDQ